MARRPRPTLESPEAIRQRLNAEATPVKLGDENADKPPKPWQPEPRDLEMYAAYVDGQTTRALAATYSVTAWAVKQCLGKVERWLCMQYMTDIRQLRVRATERLEALYAKAMTSYELSLKDEVTLTTETGPKGVVLCREKRRGQAGSRAFLAEARECTRELLEIWGAKAPEQINVNVNRAMRVGGRTPEEALRCRLEHLQKLLSPNVN